MVKDKDKEVSKAFGLDDKFAKSAVACDYVIDTAKRKITDKINKSEPRMTE